MRWNGYALISLLAAVGAMGVAGVTGILVVRLAEQSPEPSAPLAIEVQPAGLLLPEYGLFIPVELQISDAAPF